RRPAPDDHAERHGGVGSGVQRRLARDRELERARHTHEPPVGARRVERALGAGDEAVGDRVVPGAGHDDDLQAGRVDLLRLGCSVSAHALPSCEPASALSSSASSMMCPMRSAFVARYWWLFGPTPTSSGTCSTMSRPKARSWLTLSVLFVSRRTRSTPRSARMPAAAA